MRKTLKKRDIFILRRYLGTTRGQDGTQNFFKWSLILQLQNDVSHVFFGLLEHKFTLKNKRTPNKVTGLYLIHTDISPIAKKKTTFFALISVWIR